MEPGTLRILLLVAGVALLAGIYWMDRWQRSRVARDEGEDARARAPAPGASIDAALSGALADFRVQDRTAAHVPGPGDLAVIGLQAEAGGSFRPEPLRRAFSTAALHYGQHRIWHRHEDGDPEAPVVFSVANLHEPGTLDLDEDGFQASGLLLFCDLAAVQDGNAAFEAMLGCAHALQGMLGGVFCDGQHAPLDEAGIDALRDRVRQRAEHAG